MGPTQLINDDIISDAMINKWLYYSIDIIGPAMLDYCYSRTTTEYIIMPAGSQIYEAQTEGSFALLTSGGTIIDEDVYKAEAGVWSHRSGPIYTSKTGGEIEMNSLPFYVYKKTNCDKYAKWDIFWLNPHGGFDTYTFTKKVDIKYTIDRTTYKQRIPAGTPTSYDTYFGGEKIFNTNVVEEITLRTDALTQKESQMLIQLTQSPVVYVIKEYEYEPQQPPYAYGIPYIVVDNEVDYQQKVNKKEIYMSITIRPSNEKIIQNG
jgi:hypothetical protein